MFKYTSFASLTVASFVVLTQIVKKEESIDTTPVEIRGDDSQCDEAKRLIQELVEGDRGPVVCKYDSHYPCICLDFTYLLQS